MKMFLASALLIVLAIVVYAAYFSQDAENMDLEKIGNIVKPKIEDLKQFMGTLKGRLSGESNGEKDIDVDSSKSTDKSAERFPVPDKSDLSIFENQLPADNFSDPLPALNESDKSIKDVVGRILSNDYFGSLLRVEAVIVRFVVTVDNLTHMKLARKYRLVKASKGKFLTSIDLATKGTIDETYYIDEKNYQRYAGFMQLIGEIESDKLIAVYVYYYPLIQEAYDSLGYSGRYFNDRFVEVIDHLLDAPRSRQLYALERSTVTYKYVDEALEASSAGQKIMMRVGPKNQAILRNKLKQLRIALTKFEPDSN